MMTSFKFHGHRDNMRGGKQYEMWPSACIQHDKALANAIRCIGWVFVEKSNDNPGKWQIRLAGTKEDKLYPAAKVLQPFATAKEAKAAAIGIVENIANGITAW